MKYLYITLLIAFTFNISTSKAQPQALSLEKRVEQFYKVEKNQKLLSPDKIELLKGFIAPGPARDSLAVYFYDSWNKTSSNTKRMKTKIKGIKYSDDNTKAIVETEDIVTYLSGEKIRYTSKVSWQKQDESWYRSHQKSELLKSGQPLR